MQKNWQAWLRVLGIFMGILLIFTTSSLFGELLNFDGAFYTVIAKHVFFFSGYILLLPFFLMSKTKPTAIFLIVAYIVIAIAYAVTVLGIFFVTPIVLGNLYLFYDGHYLQESELKEGGLVFAKLRKKSNALPRTKAEKIKKLKEAKVEKLSQSMFGRK